MTHLAAVRQHLSALLSVLRNDTVNCSDCTAYEFPTELCLWNLGISLTAVILSYGGWNFNSGNYLFTTDTK